MQHQGRPKGIGTHGSTFHLDDALSVYMLRCLEEYRGARVVRGVDAARLLRECDIVVDVGGEYNHERRRYDHHQRGFAESEIPGIKLAASGLVWRHFGRDVLRALWPAEAATSCTPENIELLHRRVYTAFIAAVDAGDNGIGPYPRDILPEGATPLYEDKTTLAHRIKALNPRWNEGAVDFNARFERAASLAGSELCVDSSLPLFWWAMLHTPSPPPPPLFHHTLCLIPSRACVEWNVLGWLPGRQIVEKAFASRHSVHPSGRVIAFERGASPPFRDYLYDLEAAERERNPDSPRVLYAITWDGGRGQWAAIAVGPNPSSFACRLAFPPAWRGLTNTELVQACGISNAVFVHVSGFLACNTNFDCLIKMIESSMQLQQDILATL